MSRGDVEFAKLIHFKVIVIHNTEQSVELRMIKQDKNHTGKYVTSTQRLLVDNISYTIFANT